MNPVVQGVLDALGIVAPIVGKGLDELVAIVGGQRPDLVTTPLPDLADVDAARSDALKRTAGA